MPINTITKRSRRIRDTIRDTEGGNMESTIQSTTNYDQFHFLGPNREVGKGHVETLKKAFEEAGNLTEVQPLLVNERFEIIDGQHRFQAAKELGQPIFYVVREGLGINEARQMNILHKQWRTDDYAKSYAESGDASYSRYLRLREETGANHSIILSYAAETPDSSGMYTAFRNGEFTMTPQQYEETKEKLDKFAELDELVPNVTNHKEFALAILKCMRIFEYDHERMKRKLSQVGSNIPSFSSITDYQRALEDAYNRGLSAENHVRLF